MLTQWMRRAERFVKDNADDLRSDRGERSVKFRIAHAKDAKALPRSV